MEFKKNGTEKPCLIIIFFFFLWKFARFLRHLISFISSSSIKVSKERKYIHAH